MSTSLFMRMSGPQMTVIVSNKEVSAQSSPSSSDIRKKRLLSHAWTKHHYEVTSHGITLS